MPFTARASTVDDLLRSTFRALLSQGMSAEATRGAFVEIVGASLELSTVRARLSRSQSRRRAVSGIAELCWYLSASNSAEPMSFYVVGYAEGNAEIDGTVHGAYGPRLFGEGADDQIRNVISLLRTHPSSRRAVVQIFDRTDHGSPRYQDVPCTCTMQFLIREGLLHMVVGMRSNDAYLGLPHDVFAFTMLHEIVARSLGVEPGRYVHQVGSLHLYNNHAADVRSYLREGYQSTTDPMRAMPIGDPWSGIRELLAAEAEIRSGVLYHQVQLPRHPYWADLARVLAHWVARKKQNDPMLAARIAGDVVDETFRDFM